MKRVTHVEEGVVQGEGHGQGSSGRVQIGQGDGCRLGYREGTESDRVRGRKDISVGN